MQFNIVTEMPLLMLMKIYQNPEYNKMIYYLNFKDFRNFKFLI